MLVSSLIISSYFTSYFTHSHSFQTVVPFANVSSAGGKLVHFSDQYNKLRIINNVSLSCEFSINALTDGDCLVNVSLYVISE
jgi:hypothetical protein